MSINCLALDLFTLYNWSMNALYLFIYFWKKEYGCTLLHENRVEMVAYELEHRNY